MRRDAAVGAHRDPDARLDRRPNAAVGLDHKLAFSMTAAGNWTPSRRVGDALRRDERGDGTSRAQAEINRLVVG